jgi:SAM-dependent methyltransferase/uncharacterized protein YbaR (Trm112 family)
MRESLLELLRCPRCRAPSSFALEVRSRDHQEVREGCVRCRACGLDCSIEAGIVDLLHDPPDFVVREAAGLERFAEVMRADGWDRERILALPDVQLDYWFEQRRAIDEALGAIEFAPGQRLLDIGANTCWASNIFARAGLEVVALDIGTAELQGLRTADYFLETGEVYFERVLSVMFAPAFVDESFDYVFCCETMHHNDRANLRATMGELRRILRPGGRLLMVSEPLRFPLRLKRDHAQDVAAYDGYEHVYFLPEYWAAARRAGFRVRFPAVAATSRGLGEPSASPSSGLVGALKALLRRHAVGRSLVRAHRLTRYWWRHLVTGDGSVDMFCEKP